ncbi:MAG: hypothetical protein Q4G36_05325 [Paracoccus sp. (in: a-proteobacteria)]|nr:hypothetical protein [Paracoccus sp. (in: a-proteobacteria)]
MAGSGENQRIQVAYIGGGSVNWAVRLMEEIGAQSRFSARLRLYDIDHAAAQRNAWLAGQFGAMLSAEAVAGLGAALRGADVVVILILPGSLDEMGHDIALPAEYGIVQWVGDTVGPGGFMRTIPAMVEISRAIETHAPRAMVCNLTSPISALTEAACARDCDGLPELFLSDPLVAPIGLDKGRELYRRMIAATAACLPETLVKGAA